MEKSIKKRVAIIAIYVLIVLLTVWLFNYLFGTKPTCFDGKKNQNEEEIDCGGRCAKKCGKIEAEELIIGEQGVLESSVVGEYDFYVEVVNPNNIYGSEEFSYEIIFKDAGGATLFAKKGNNFILPGEKKYVVENNIKVESVPASVEFSIIDSDWVELDEFYERPNLKVVNKNYNEITSGMGFFEATGLLENRSPYDFTVIKVRVILRDENKKIIALNSTEMRNVNSNEDRDYRVFWPSRFSGEVANAESQVEVNIFKSESFVKKYFKSKKFQQYK